MDLKTDGQRFRYILEELEYEEDYEVPLIDPTVDSDYSDLEEEQSEYLENDRHSEEDLSDYDDDEIPSQSIFSNSLFQGKDKTTIWSASPITNRTQRTEYDSHNKIGPIGEAELTKTKLDCFNLFFDRDSLNTIVNYTNIKIMEIQGKYKKVAKLTDYDEICAFIGILYMAGVCHSRKPNILDVWRKDGFGVEIFRLVMGVNRFKFLLKTIRFDNVIDSNRNARKQIDKLYCIRELFDYFVDKCKMHYNHSASVTVDEMLLSLKGPCSFHICVPSKPGKYFIKVWACSDVNTFYTSNLEIFLQNQPKNLYVSNDSKAIILRMVNHIEGSGRNVTCNNFFTSIPLAEELLKKKLTIVGAIRKDEKEVPVTFYKKHKTLRIPSFVFGFTPTSTLVSYRLKKDKTVILLSTLHNDAKIDESAAETFRPDIVSYYNKTKIGVETSDAMQKQYSVSRVVNRWPMAIFFFMLDIGALNAFIIYKSNIKCNIKRKDFLFELGKALCLNHCKSRSSSQNLSSSLKSRIISVFGLPRVSNLKESKTEVTTSVEKNVKCVYCNSKKSRKIVTRCYKCNKPICKEHRATMCLVCASSLLPSMEMDEDDAH